MKELRTCIGCRQIFSKKDMLRIVAASDGRVETDEHGTKPGRGAYICRNVKCLESCIRHGGLDRSFRRKIDDSVYDELKARIKEMTDPS